MAFIKLLDSPELREMFFADTKRAREASKYLNALTTHMYTHVATYFEIRYTNVIDLLGKLITIAASTLLDMDARRLISVARAKSVSHESETRTADMRNALIAIQARASADACAKIAALIDGIEHALSEEHAAPVVS